jgi:DNA invertase Pin-like site-specific DNA recombinase
VSQGLDLGCCGGNPGLRCNPRPESSECLRYAAAVLRRPNALTARSLIFSGLRSPVPFSRIIFEASKRLRKLNRAAAQREAVSYYLNGGDWRIICEFTEVESSRRADRPELEKALAAARVHRVPLVIAKVDRLTRSVAFLSRLLEAGVDVRFADLPALAGPTGRFMLQQTCAVAELEAGFIRDRTKRALAAAKARGKRLGGTRGVILTRAARNRAGNSAGG